jgi:hypothetical protein
MSWPVLLGLAIAALAVPFLLAAARRDNYADNEGMSVEDWRKVWRFLTGRRQRRHPLEP